MTEQSVITVADVATAEEKAEYQALVRSAGRWALLTLIVLLPLGGLRWLGDWADGAIERITRPMRRAEDGQDEIMRKWERAARRLRAKRAGEVG